VGLTWPQGETPFDVEALIHLGRRCESATDKSNPRLIRAAESVRATAVEYIAGLPPEVQGDTARRLVQALAERLAYKSKVQPKKPQGGRT